MNVKFIDFDRIHNLIIKDISKGINKIIKSNKFIDGFHVSKFEESFAAYCGVKYCVAVNSGTSAIHLAIHVLKTNKLPVITVSNTFFATVEGISYNNLPVQFLDIDKHSHNLDTNELAKLDSFGGVAPVSLYGNPCELQEIEEIAKLKNAFVVHDACQAHGAFHKGRKIASFGDITCYSFYPSKNLGAFGEGGAIVTNNEALYKLIKILKAHGQTQRYVHSQVGYNYRMDEIQGFVLNEKLKYLDEWNDSRINAAKCYIKNLSNNKNFKLLEVKEYNKCVYHLFPIFVKNRNKLSEYLNSEGVETGFHYPIPIHLQKAFETNDILPNTEKSCNEELSLPIFAGITEEEIDYVCEKLNNYLI